jgi:hypothetical protein
MPAKWILPRMPMLLMIGIITLALALPMSTAKALLIKWQQKAWNSGKSRGNHVDKINNSSKYADILTGCRVPSKPKAQICWFTTMPNWPLTVILCPSAIHSCLIFAVYF